MKILHVMAQLPARTGSGVYYRNMIEEFKAYGHTQKALFAMQPGYGWEILGEEDSYPVHFQTEELPFPIAGMSDVMPYEHTVYSEMTDTMLDQWKAAFREKLEEIKKEYEPDLIFAHHLWILTSMVREIFPDTKVIGICHNTDLRQARMNPSIKENHVLDLDRLDFVYAASEEQKKEIEEVYSIPLEKQVAVGGGFNQNIFYPPSKKEYSKKIRLAYCAKIDPSKGIYELVEAYRELGLEDTSLDIIGVPQEEENRKRITKAIEGDDSIRLYNVKNQVALGDELRTKDIFLMPSYYEGLGLMAIESLACGLYVVTTEIEALMSLLGDGIKDSGVIEYVPLPRIYDVDKPYDEDLPLFKERLKEAILRQVEKVRRQEAFPEEVAKEIKTHSWQGLVGKMNDFIESL
ncbi:MAG: glycosyltransferase family 4 protein [Tissierellia bacterium]|nr:glycosyltransferase family 4 protein [Tissierellia bacterium]